MADALGVIVVVVVGLILLRKRRTVARSSPPPSRMSLKVGFRLFLAVTAVIYVAYLTAELF